MSGRIERLISELTPAEKCTMVQGLTPWIVPGCERLGIPEWCVSDGPVGVRGRANGPGLVVPGPSALAATWDPALVEEVGAALGVEARDRKVEMVLAPTVNIHRVPVGGRHFECYSEDPFLSARTAVGFVRGVQSEGVGACVKHYVANDQEYQRRTISSAVDERTLREVYLVPFEAAVREAGVWSVMAAYNFVNGVHACAHEQLLVEVLKAEWGFDGFVVSDWFAMKDLHGPANHGLDLEMPGPGRHWGDGKLVAAVAAGEVDERAVDDKVRRILRFLAWCGKLDGTTDHDEETVERPEHRALARRAATESMVLVRNPRRTLPIDAGSVRSIALIGPGAVELALQGGGSSNLEPARRTSLPAALAARLGDTVEIRVTAGASLERAVPSPPPEWLGPDGATVELFEGPTCAGEAFLVESGRRLSNVWTADTLPPGVGRVSARVSATVTPPRTGAYRLLGAGFGHVTVGIDGGPPLVDNRIGAFWAGHGRQGASTIVELEGGRPYRLVLEHEPGAGDDPLIVITKVGLAPHEDAAAELRAEAVEAAKHADVAVVVAGSNQEWESEGADRTSLDLPAAQDALIEAVAAANPNTVVVLNCGAPMLMPWIDVVAAVLLAWYPGQEGGEALAEVLLGAAEPGGRMVTTWPVRVQDTPAFTSYPGEAGVVRYGEGGFVGYRWYDARAIEPLVPFGHGGSYTDFEWGVPAVAGTAPELVVEVPVTNTGARRGSEVVQVYVSPPCGSVLRPPQVLAGFAKVGLVPGETGTARVELGERSFARWDVVDHGWVVDPGEYTLHIGSSSRTIRSSVPVTMG